MGILSLLIGYVIGTVLYLWWVKHFSRTIKRTEMSLKLRPGVDGLLNDKNIGE